MGCCRGETNQISTSSIIVGSESHYYNPTKKVNSNITFNEILSTNNNNFNMNSSTIKPIYPQNKKKSTESPFGQSSFCLGHKRSPIIRKLMTKKKRSLSFDMCN